MATATREDMTAPTVTRRERALLTTSHYAKGESHRHGAERPSATPP